MRHGTHTTLDNLCLEISPGRVLCVLGPNGAGKTTTINLFMGFLTPTRGRAEVAGIDVTTNPREARRNLAFIPESVALYGNLTGIENLQYFAQLGGVRGVSADRCAELLERAGLQSTAFHRQASTYSKGMRQKVCVALALAKDAKAMLLDEPTSGLDPYAASEFSALVRSLASQGVGAMVATHDLLLAKQMSHEVLILVAGQARKILPTQDLDVAYLEEVYLAELVKAPPLSLDPQ